jgi:tetrahydromethanopterin S-methyltransferase subunit G
MSEGEKLDKMFVTVIRTEESVKNIARRLDDIEAKMEKDYVRRSSFEPVQKLVYGVVGVILMAFITALVSMIIIGGG